MSILPWLLSFAIYDMKFSLPLFIARRLYREEGSEKRSSRPAVFIATVGIAVGLAVMILAVFVTIGFKQQVRDKVAGFTSHIRIDAPDGYGARPTPVRVDDSLLAILHNDPEVEHIQRYSRQGGVIKTADSFQGIVLKGVGPEYRLDFFRQHLVEGEVPQFSDTASSNRAVLSLNMAHKLKLKLGDRIDIYFLDGEKVRARRLQIVGIYQTNFSEFDNLFLLTDLYLVNRLNRWDSSQAGGLELSVRHYDRLDETTWRLGDELLSYAASTHEGRYVVRNVEQLYTAIFAWLGILDVNIWVILALMIGVAGFTMVSGLLIIIIERTSMIGILKSLGAGNALIRKTFLWFAVFLIGRGMLWGNVVGLLICGVQAWLRPFQLDPETYYMDTVPIGFNLWWWLLLNVGTMLASVLMLVGPSYLITRIRPADSMRYE